MISLPTRVVGRGVLEQVIILTRGGDGQGAQSLGDAHAQEVGSGIAQPDTAVLINQVA